MWEVIDAAATKPYGFMRFFPGPGLGGHCIPIDPLFLAWKMKTLKYRTRFIELAAEVNAEMPLYVIRRAAEALNSVRKPVNGSRILVLGVAYKPDVNDTRESPALDIIALLRHRGAVVEYHDPHVPALELESGDLTSVDARRRSGLEAADLVLIATDHSDVDYEFVGRHASLVVDPRNAMAELREGGGVPDRRAASKRDGGLGAKAMTEAHETRTRGPVRAVVRRVPPLHRLAIRTRAMASIVRPPERTSRKLWIYSDGAGRRLIGSGDGPNPRFVIYGQGRSGSSVLLDLIGSHPDVYCESEIFNKKVAARLLRPWALPAGPGGPVPEARLRLQDEDLPDDGRPGRRGCAPVHDGSSRGGLERSIHLVREDLFRKALSLVVAETRGQFLDRRSGEEASIRLPSIPARLAEAMRERRSADEAEQAALEGIPHIRVTYEDDLLDAASHQAVSDRVLEFLGLDSAPVETRYVRTSRGHVSDYVSNWKDVHEFLSKTEFAPYLPVHATPEPRVGAPSSCLTAEP